MLKRIEKADKENEILQAKLEAIENSSRRNIAKAIRYNNEVDKPKAKKRKIERSNEDENDILSKEETEVSGTF